MGVLRCARRNCSGIMCDRYSPNYGYLCGDCFSELVDQPSTVDILEFLNTEPKTQEVKKEDMFKKWDSEFSIRR